MTEFIISQKEINEIVTLIVQRKILLARKLLGKLRPLNKEKFSHNTIINEKTKSLLDGEFPKEVRKSEEKKEMVLDC